MGEQKDDGGAVDVYICHLFVSATTKYALVSFLVIQSGKSPPTEVTANPMTKQPSYDHLVVASFLLPNL